MGKWVFADLAITFRVDSAAYYSFQQIKVNLIKTNSLTPKILPYIFNFTLTDLTYVVKINKYVRYDIFGTIENGGQENKTTDERDGDGNVSGGRVYWLENG